MSLAAVVLAAGEGKRLKTRRAKVLHQAAGKALLDHVLAAVGPLAPEPTLVVVGHLRQQVEAHLTGRAVVTVVQDPPRGTGDAVAVAVARLGEVAEVLVVSGDVPLVRTETIAGLVALRRAERAAAAVLTAVLPAGGGYGRIVRGVHGDVDSIVEARDASDEVRAICEVNAGTYAFDAAALRPALVRLSPDNDQGEYYLTDVIGMFAAGGLRVVASPLADPDEMTGVNTRAELADVHRLLNGRIVRQLQVEGVTVLDPATTWVESGCAVGADTVLEPGVHLRRDARVGVGCRIGAHAVLEGVVVPDGAVVAPLSYLHRKT